MATQLLDLSHQISAGMTTYPGLPGPVIDDHVSFEDSHATYAPGTEFQIARITMVANTGTYLDTPAHRYRNGADVADVALDRIAALPGTVIDLPADAGRAFTPEHIDTSAVAGRAVLLRTGWDRNWRTERYGSADHPYLTAQGAQALADAGAQLVGIDAVNIDDTAAPEGERPAHSILLAAGIPVVEHLCLLDQLPRQGFEFFAVPAKVRGMGTFPVRAFATLATT
ncbi:cyclase family protein [Lipingzhangella sp. LS1_29]|uniref:Cyclase family protein n=1 Tax=Lipingzhangella rawalii TaxID=2055835 RepID=A0ABU2H1I5_9ACTN|nr:cyclase family protein [Lipingzhangella rawalii]MDS1269167.1 cyclase family protein [Lipingzhangella rawalii]